MYDRNMMKRRNFLTGLFATIAAVPVLMTLPAKASKFWGSKSHLTQDFAEWGFGTEPFSLSVWFDGKKYQSDPDYVPSGDGTIKFYGPIPKDGQFIITRTEK